MLTSFNNYFTEVNAFLKFFMWGNSDICGVFIFRKKSIVSDRFLKEKKHAMFMPHNLTSTAAT